MNRIQNYCNKKVFIAVAAAALVLLLLMSLPLNVMAAGVDTADRAEFNKTVAYLVTAVIAFVLLLGYCGTVKQKETLFVFLFAAVFVVNAGYAFGSSSTTLEEALLANKISYMGAVFLPLFMLLIIMGECRIKKNKIFVSALLCVSTAIFFLTMTPGYTPWYYKSVELVFENGGAKLVKQYGPLHSLYLLYLVLYFGLMIAVILLAMQKKESKLSPKVPVILLVLVLGNILVWFIEQKVNLGFEFLAISYLITEMCLLTIYNEHHLPNDVDCCSQSGYTSANIDKTFKPDHDEFDSGAIPDFGDIVEVWPQVALLTTREVEVFKEIIMNKKRKEIAEKLCVSENTVKKHTTNIFTKLEVSSRVEIMNMLLKIK